MPAELRALASRLEQWLLDAALPLWWNTGADHEHGGFYEAIDLSGRPSVITRRARVQARQSFVYSLAGTLEWSGPSEKAARHGLEYLDRHYRNADGLYCTLVSNEGAVLDPTATLYDQAFALLAMAWMFRRDSSYFDKAGDLLSRIYCGMGYAGGGFTENSAQRFQSNPHMHLFEAALAWREVNSASHWTRLADNIAELCLTRFIDSNGGFLREFFDGAWNTQSGSSGHVVEPGHQFEWAWLLLRWARLSQFGPARIAAQRLFEAGTRGVDSARHVAVDEIDDELNITRPTARLWPQTERLKAAIALSEHAGRVERGYYLAEAAAAAEVLLRFLNTPTAGLWRDKLLPNNEFVEEPAPASSFYHLACAIEVLGVAMRA
jgi:mannose-1-phosphate guanylyltransferase / mannose-6-phosphate isomerase